jgi:hypothetical protein
LYICQIEVIQYKLLVPSYIKLISKRNSTNQILLLDDLVILFKCCKVDLIQQTPIIGVRRTVLTHDLSLTSHLNLLVSSNRVPALLLSNLRSTNVLAIEKGRETRISMEALFGRLFASISLGKLLVGFRVDMTPSINTRGAVLTGRSVVSCEQLTAIFVGHGSASHWFACVQSVGAGSEAAIALALVPGDIATIVLACQFLIMCALIIGGGYFGSVAYSGFLAVRWVAGIRRVAVPGCEGDEAGR